MKKLLILTSNIKSDLNSLRNNEFILELMITDIFRCCNKVSELDRGRGAFSPPI